MEPRTAVTAPRSRRWQGAAALLLIVASVAAGTLSRVDPGSRQPAATVVQVDEGARDHLVRAQHFMHRRLPGDLDRARQNLLDAIAIDPRFARAWAGLASVHWLATVERHVTPEQGLPQVREAAERALALDPNLAEAHLRLANYLCQTGRQHEAHEHLAAATALEPGNPLVLSIAAGIFARDGQLDQAIELQQHAVAADPLSLVNRGNLVAFMTIAERLDEAEVEIRRLQELNADTPDLDSHHARLLILDGRFEEALVLAATMPEGAERRFAEAIAHHRLGNSAAADAALGALLDAPAIEVPALQISEVFAARGEPDQALAWLNKVPEHSIHDPSIEYSPFLRTLRSDPRWNEWVTVSRRRASAPRYGAGAG